MMKLTWDKFEDIGMALYEETAFGVRHDVPVSEYGSRFTVRIPRTRRLRRTGG